MIDGLMAGRACSTIPHAPAYEEKQFDSGSTEEDQRLVLFQRGEFLQTAADAHALFRFPLGERILAVSKILLGTDEPRSLRSDLVHCRKNLIYSSGQP